MGRNKIPWGKCPGWVGSSDPKSRVAIKCRMLIWVAGYSFKLHRIFFCFWFTPCFIQLFDFAGAWAQVLRAYSTCICPLISLSRLIMVILPPGPALSLIWAIESHLWCDPRNHFPPMVPSLGWTAWDETEVLRPYQPTPGPWCLSVRE